MVSQRASGDTGRSHVLYTVLKSVLSKAVSYPEIVQQVDLVIGECTCTQLIQKASLN